MSSHHIVREKQEPALLVLSISHFTDELLGQLLEWSPTVIATAATAESLTSAGIKVDVVIGELTNDEELQSDLKHIGTSQNNENGTAMQYLVANGYPAVNVVADIFSMDDYLPFADSINVVIYSGNKKIYPVTSGFSKWKPAGEEVMVLNSVADLEVTGLASIGTDEYQTTTDGFFSLQFTGRYLFISENIL